MRALRRWLRQRTAEKRIAPRVHTLTTELTGHFGPGIKLVPVGAAGRDSIYRVVLDDAPVAVVRLINPYRQRAQLPPESPFVWLDDDRRLEHEWHAYTVGAAAGITPPPVWRCADAIACRYVPWRSLFAQFEEQPAQFWDYFLRGTRAVAALHRAGLTHMDANLGNILTDETGTGAVFVDFEYGPAPSVGPAVQRAYDYLRLLESSVKFLSEPQRRATGPWLALLAELVDAETAAANLSVLRPALSRLHADTQLATAIRRVFTGF